MSPPFLRPSYALSWRLIKIEPHDTQMQAVSFLDDLMTFLWGP
jgi:hypothetical protein